MIRWYETKWFNKIATFIITVAATIGFLLLLLVYIGQFTSDESMGSVMLSILMNVYHPFVFAGYYLILLPFSLWTWAMATRFPIKQSDLEKFPQKQLQWMIKKMSRNDNAREYLKNAEVANRLRIFLTMVIALFSNYVFMVTIAIQRSIVPYLNERVQRLSIDNPMVYESLFSNIHYTINFLVIIPTLITFMITLILASLANTHWKELVELFKTWEYKKGWKKDNIFEGEYETKLHPPDIDLGPDSETKEMVRLLGQDRTLNSTIIGSIGTGKTAALVLPLVNQDLHHMTKMINNFKEYYSRKDYHTEEVKGQLLNGISIIEPSNDLCQKVYQLVKAHRIPDEVVYYLDPTNPDTPSINLFNAPVDKVAEMFTMVIEGIGENVEFFFAQSQRVHLKHYIYLLMLHDDNVEPTFDDLIDMYNETQLVSKLHQKLKVKIRKMKPEALETRDEKNEYRIIKGIDEWFDQTLEVMTQGRGDNERVITNKDRNSPYFGEPLVIDKKEEHVVGLRNILNDISANIEIRRVLFGKSNFDFDKHLEFGGILLVNTSKGTLANLSDVLGKFVLLSLQNAVFRRKPNVSPFHSIIVDEFPDYVYEDFASFPAQSRKYKAIVQVVGQTVSQLSRKYREDFMHILLSTLRNKFVYGDVSPKDAEIFSAIFGSKDVYTESETEQTVSALQDDPSRRMGYSYAKEERPIMSPSDIIYQKEFQCAVKLVENNKPIPVRQIEANFVPREEFSESKYTVNPEAAEYWYKVRQSNLDNTYIKVEEGILEEEIRQAELEEQQMQDDKKNKVEPYIIPEAQFDRKILAEKGPLKWKDDKSNDNSERSLNLASGLIDQRMFDVEVEKSLSEQISCNSNFDENLLREKENRSLKETEKDNGRIEEPQAVTGDEEPIGFMEVVASRSTSSTEEEGETNYESKQHEVLRNRREKLKDEYNYEEDQRRGLKSKHQFAKISSPSRSGERLLDEMKKFQNDSE